MNLLVYCHGCSVKRQGKFLHTQMRTSLLQRVKDMEESLHQSEFDQQGLHREVSVNKIIIVCMHCSMVDGIILMFIGS